MGIPVMILGESGSGKSASMRNFKPGEIMVFNVANKPLPFRGGNKHDIVPNAGYRSMYSEIQDPKYKRYVIDDSQYLMCFEAFAKVKETGYQKYSDMAIHFYNLVKLSIAAPDDVIVYFLHHVDMLENGKVKAKTLGKMLDNQLTLEGLFSIVLLCQTDGSSHRFITQSDGMTTAKSPMGMFDIAIDNDLKMVDEAIRNYYEI